jgi:hypothetical protein
MRETIVLQGFAGRRQLWFTFGLGKPITIEGNHHDAAGRSRETGGANLTGGIFEGGSKSALGRWSEGVGEHVRTRFRSSKCA